MLALSLLPIERLIKPLAEVTAASKTIALYALGAELRPLRALCGSALISASAALCEEIAFRGVLQTLATRALRALGAAPRPTVAAAVAAQAILFGVAHSYTNSPVYLITASIVGMVFGAAFAATGNLAVPIAMHFAVDMVTFLACHVQVARAGREAQCKLLAAESPIATTLRRAFLPGGPDPPPDESGPASSA